MSDSIDRSIAIKMLIENKPMIWQNDDYELGMLNQYENDLAIIKAVPSAEPESTMGQLTELSQSTKDCISREAAIDALCDNCDNVKAVCAHYPCKQYIAIEQLPFAEPKKGKWIKLYAGNYKCSECRDWWSNDDGEMIKNFKFCPNCGTQMSEGEENE